MKRKSSQDKEIKGKSKRVSKKTADFVLVDESEPLGEGASKVEALKSRSIGSANELDDADSFDSGKEDVDFILGDASGVSDRAHDNDELNPYENSLDGDIEPLDDYAESLSDSRDMAIVSRGSRAVVPFDPLRKYLDDISKYELLTQDEEKKLAAKVKDGDIRAAKLLVASNLRLVVKIAMEYKNTSINVLDLIQEGNIGLMKAVSKYEPTAGAKLSYYASWWIRSYILKYILDNFRLVKVGTTQAQKKLFYRLLREREKIEALGMEAGPKLLAEKLDVKEKEINEMDLRLSSGSELSLDNKVGSGDEGGEKRFLDTLSDDSEMVDNVLADEELKLKLADVLTKVTKKFDDREKAILEERLLADEPKTLQEIADKYKLTRERARQIESSVIKKIREAFDHDNK